MYKLKRKVIAMGLCLFVLTACQNEQEQAKERLARGKELLQKGDLKSAELELKSAIQSNNNLADSYYTMALLNEKSRNYPAMKENLEQAVKLEPDNIDARLKLGKVLLLFNDVEGAAKQAEYVIEKKPSDLVALSLKAAILIRQKKTSDALPIIDSILQQDPGNVDAVSLKALVYMENEDFDGALSLLDPAIEANAENPSLHLLKIQLNAKKKDIDAVIKEYRQLIKMYPNKDQLKIALAKLLVHAKKPEQAEKLLREYVAENPKKIRPKFVLLSFLVSLDEDRAMQQFKEYASQYENQPKQLLQLSKWLLLRKKTDSAKTYLEKIAQSKSKPEKLEARLLLAKMAFQQQDFKTASSLIDGILEEDSENQDAQILQARVLVTKKKYQEAKTLLTSVLWSHPKSDETIVMLAQLELLEGNEKQAVRKFREALEINPSNLNALFPVVNNLIKEQNFGYATEILGQALKQKPGNIMLLQKLAQIKMVEKDWDTADKILQLMAKQPNKGAMIANFMQAKIFQEKREYDKAIEKYKELLTKMPYQLDAMQEMARSYEALNQRDKMIEYLSSLITQTNNNIPAYLVKSKLYLLNKQFDKANATLTEALKVNNKVPQTYLTLADTFLQQQKYQEAINSLLQGQTAIPDNLKIPLKLAAVYKRTGQNQKAAKVYEMLIGKNDKLDVVANEYASLLVDFFGDQESLQKARQLAIRFKDSRQPFYLDTYAWTELKLGNVSEALEILKKVNSVAASIPVFKFHLGVAYHQAGQDSVAISELKQAIELGKKQGGFAENETAKKLLDKLLKPVAS